MVWIVHCCWPWTPPLLLAQISQTLMLDLRWEWNGWWPRHTVMWVHFSLCAPRIIWCYFFISFWACLTMGQWICLQPSLNPIFREKVVFYQMSVSKLSLAMWFHVMSHYTSLGHVKISTELGSKESKQNPGTHEIRTISNREMFSLEVL